jgi:hypothetical protein
MGVALSAFAPHPNHVGPSSALRAPSPRRRGEGQDGHRLPPPSPRLRGVGWVRGKATNSAFPEKGGRLPKIPQQNQQNKVFSSPPISTLLDSSLSRLRIHLTMRCQARQGRRRGGVLSQAQIPGPLQRSPSGRGAGNEGDGVGCLFTGYPDRKDVPQRHTDKAPTPSRTSPDGGATKTAGMMGRGRQ